MWKGKDKRDNVSNVYNKLVQICHYYFFLVDAVVINYLNFYLVGLFIATKEG